MKCAREHGLKTVGFLYEIVRDIETGLKVKEQYLTFCDKDKSKPTMEDILIMCSASGYPPLPSHNFYLP